MPNEEKIIGYLEAGRLIAAVMTIEEDPLTDPPAKIGPPDVRTDGPWAWPQTLAYYVERYHLSLPQEFVQHMEGKAWQCPEDIQANGTWSLGDDIPMS